MEMEMFKNKVKEWKPWKPINFWKWYSIDMYRYKKYGKKFSEFGLTFYCGRQGAGKTMAMIEYLERMRKEYPKAIIITNFFYIHQDKPMESWKDLLEIRNGEDGVIFALDEIQNEWNSTNWKDFPESLLSEITQQRKQRIKIVCTSQVFTRVVKQLREQAFEVVECRTLGGRWTFTRCFDAEDYTSQMIENPELKKTVKRKWRKSFVQSDEIRELYDTYEKVKRLKGLSYMTREERGVL